LFFDRLILTGWFLFGLFFWPNALIRVLVHAGGPGSNKSSLCQKVLRANAGWGHVSVGPLMRSLASSLDSLQETISSGHIIEEVTIRILLELIFITDYIFVFISFQSIVHEILDKELLKYKNVDGIVIDGYPRNIGQLNYFEKKVPTTIKM